MSCALDGRAQEDQLARLASLGEHALWMRRLPTELTLVLDPDLDDAIVRETLAVERGCCPFFALIWDEERRELTVATREERKPAFERIARAFGGAPVASL
jgi:hypothetical protein